MQVEISTVSISDDMLKLDPLELPAEFRLLSTAPPLGTWQYTERPFSLNLKVDWFQPGTTVTQVVEFSEANSRVSQDGELVTDVLYYVKSRGQRTLKIGLPDKPVRLWAATVNGRPVTARQANDATLIPLPGGTDPNIPVEVRLRLGKPTVDEFNPQLTLPIVFSPVLKTQWSIVGDEKHVLVPGGGTVTPPMPVLRPSGFDWVAKRGIVSLFVIGLFTGIGIWACNRTGFWRLLGLLGLVISIGAAISTAMTALSETGPPAPLQLSLPILAAGETVELEVNNLSLWRVNLSWVGLIVGLIGIGIIVWSLPRVATLIGAWIPRSGDGGYETRRNRLVLIRGIGILLLAVGVLFQRDGAPWFCALLALAILILLVLPRAFNSARDFRHWVRGIAERRKAKKEAKADSSGGDSGAMTATIALIAMALSSNSSNCLAQVPAGFEAADSITQQWQVTHQDARLIASGTITLSGNPGDRFMLLRAPAVLTRFEGDGLRLTKREVPGQGLTYIISIPVTEEADEAVADDSQKIAGDFKATFEFQLEALKPTEGVAVFTGTAAVQEINLSYDEAGWDISGPTAVRVEPVEAAAGTTQVKVLLGPGPAKLLFKPQARDVTTEETQFFVEASNLYLPGPGVIDGRHRLHIRTSQGQVSELSVLVPKGLTVSAVGGPVGSWQFDADSGRLKLEIEPTQSQAFDVMIDTQRGLDPLPADVNLAPLKVAEAGGEVGLVAIAFGPDAQPEKLEPETMSVVNLGDFDAGLISHKQAVLHRVYRYGADGGQLALRVAPVDSEVRVFSKQVISLGDERLVLSVNFAAEISRAGLFQLSFSTLR